MKNKSLIISLSILAFFVLIIILSSAVFSLKNVEVNFFSNTINLTNSEQEIIESGDFKYNQSIFFINKKKYIKNLEKNNPYLKVLNIETIFPNKLSINCVERNELFVLKGYENNVIKSYMVMDDEVKVLNNLSSFTNSYLNPILLTFENEFSQNFLAGQVLDTSYSNLLKNLSVELLAYEDNILKLYANFEEIIIGYENPSDVCLKMRSGTQIVLKEANIRLTEKFMLALSAYNQKEDKTTGQITTYENNDGKVVGYVA